MARSAIPVLARDQAIPDFASLHPGYLLTRICGVPLLQAIKGGQSKSAHQGELLMRSISTGFRAFALGIAGLLLLASGASAAEVRVMISGGLTAAYKELVPEFERLTGNKVITAYGPSMGTTANAIPVRLERGEPADVLIMVGYALGDLATQGKVAADSRVDLV